MGKYGDHKQFSNAIANKYINKNIANKKPPLLKKQMSNITEEDFIVNTLE